MNQFDNTSLVLSSTMFTMLMMVPSLSDALLSPVFGDNSRPSGYGCRRTPSLSAAGVQQDKVRRKQKARQSLSALIINGGDFHTACPYLHPPSPHTLAPAVWTPAARL